MSSEGKFKYHRGQTTEWLMRRRDQLKDARDESFFVNSLLNERAEDVARVTRRKRLADISKIVEWREPQYPDVGVVARHGTCVINNENQAEELLEALKAESSYQYSYLLDWSGPGRYLAEVEWAYDQDNDIAYVINIERKL